MQEQTRDLTLPAGADHADTATGSIFFIGNATVLLRWGGFTVLTDPTFIHMHEETWLGYGLHTRRLTNPAIEITQLPPLDFVLLSHFHGDHFDQVAERELDKALPIVTPPEAAKALAERGFTNTLPLPTWASTTVRKGNSNGAALRITAAPGRHGPPLSQFVLPDVMGSVVELLDADGAARFTLYITGDTMVFDDLKELPRRYPGVDLALLHLGGTMVMGVLVTMDAKEGVEMVQLVQPRAAIPIHYNDYDVFKSPVEDFLREAEAAGLRDRIHFLRHGDTFNFAVAGL